MKIVGNYVRKLTNEENNIELTLSINPKYRISLQELEKDVLYSISISKARDKRTEQQNRYMWALIAEIDKAINGERSNDENEIYIRALVRCGAKYDYVLSREDCVEALKKQFRATQFIRKVKMSNGDIREEYKVFYGSSTMDKKEMANLIDTILDMATECGIKIDYWKDVLLDEKQPR